MSEPNYAPPTIEQDFFSLRIIQGTGNALQLYDLRRKQLKQFDLDKVKEVRLSQQLCRACFYLRGNEKMADVEHGEHNHCPACNDMVMSKPGHFDAKIHLSCAQKHNICLTCCSDIEMNKDRIGVAARKSIRKRIDKWKEDYKNGRIR